MGIISSNLDTEIDPHRRRQTDETWPCQSSTQMDPSLHLSTCVNNRVGPANMVTGAVPVTTSLASKSEWKEKYSLKEW